MGVTLHNDAVVIPHRPDWRQPVEWSRSWDTRIESAVSGSESRVGLRLKPRERIRFRVVPYDLTERLALIERLKAAAKLGLGLCAHWGRGSELAALASGSVLTVVADGFRAQPGDVVFIQSGDIEGYEDFDLATVVLHRNQVFTVAAPLSRTYPAGSRVYPTVEGRVTVGELEALEDWRQAVVVEIQQLRTVPDNDAVLYQFDYWLHGSPLPRVYAGESMEHWLHGAPAINP